MLEGDVLGFYNLNETSLVVGRIGVGSGKSLLNLHVASGDLCYHTMIRINEFEKSKSLGGSYLAVLNIVLDIKIENQPCPGQKAGIVTQSYTFSFLYPGL